MAVAAAGFWLTRDTGSSASEDPAAGVNAAVVERSEKDVFIEKADALCARMNDQLAQLSQPTSMEEIPGYIRINVQITKDTVRKIKQLDIPTEDRAILNKMFAAIEQAVRVSKQLTAAALPGGDPTALQPLANRMEALGQKANGLALKYGLVTCAEPA
ncbi:MAG: hypothetical protein M3217_00880 [Actinomycetota bacterium]|nr:hypothetical protein [Actinomycetota bacterium]